MKTQRGLRAHATAVVLPQSHDGSRHKQYALSQVVQFIEDAIDLKTRSKDNQLIVLVWLNNKDQCHVAISAKPQTTWYTISRFGDKRVF